MSRQRHLSFIDRIIVNADQALRTLSPGAASAARPSPARQRRPAELSEAEARHAAGLMRVNHTGEVCAQALYQGQALTARQSGVSDAMQQSAREEEDHLAWCEERLAQLDSHTSYLNPLWYGLSFGLGAAAGLAGDKWSLGFVAATEDQVCEHLRQHLRSLPPQDDASRAIVEQMLEDEAAHASKALAAGGVRFPLPLKRAMSLLSKAMTKTTYYV